MSRIRGPHAVDRALPEILQEVRVAQTGGQVFFAFLFSVAFTPGFDKLDSLQRAIYAWDLFIVAAAVSVLIAPVAVHQVNFGLGMRPQLLVVSHVLAIVGLVLLSLGIVLGVLLVGSMISPEAAFWLPAASGAIIVMLWAVLPVWVRVRGRAWPVSDAPPEELSSRP